MPLVACLAQPGSPPLSFCASSRLCALGLDDRIHHLARRRHGRGKVKYASLGNCTRSAAEAAGTLGPSRAASGIRGCRTCAQGGRAQGAHLEAGLQSAWVQRLRTVLRATRGFSAEATQDGNRMRARVRACVRVCPADLGLCEARDVPKLVEAAEGDLLEDAAHHLAAAGLGQPGGPGGKCVGSREACTLTFQGWGGAGCKGLRTARLKDVCMGPTLPGRTTSDALALSKRRQ
jgi:hypothetical protein